MNTHVVPSGTASRTLLANIQDLAPGITARAAEIETARRIPADIIDALKSAGLFRMFVPRIYGGLELDLCRATPR